MDTQPWLSLVAVVVAAAAYFAVWATIYFKAGYAYFLLMAVGMFVPLVSLVLLLWFLFGEWPVRKQLRQAQRYAIKQAL